MYATIKDLSEFYLNANLPFVLFCRNKGDQQHALLIARFERNSENYEYI